MSRADIELFERALEAVQQRGDFSVFANMLAPDVEWRAWNDDGNCHSREEVMAVVRTAIAYGAPVELPEFIDAGDKLVLIPRHVPPFFPRELELHLLRERGRPGRPDTVELEPQLLVHELDQVGTYSHTTATPPPADGPPRAGRLLFRTGTAFPG